MQQPGTVPRTGWAASAASAPCTVLTAAERKPAAESMSPSSASDATGGHARATHLAAGSGRVARPLTPLHSSASSSSGQARGSKCSRHAVQVHMQRTLRGRIADGGHASLLQEGEAWTYERFGTE